MTWIDLVLDSAKEAETPQSFVKWAAFSAMSAILKKNVYLDKFMYKLYPNIYVMLIAKSGSRKGFAVAVAKELVKHVNNTRVISGRNSIQAVVEELGKTYSNENGQPPVTDACGFLVTGELATFLIEDPGSITILTDLYDTHYNKEWKNTLKSGKDVLKDVCLTMLSASNQTLFKEAIPQHGYSGGFMARTLVIHEEKRGKKNPLTKAPTQVFDASKLGPYLTILSKLKGPFAWDKDAAEAFEKWYEEFKPEEKDDKTGTADRLHDQILKVSMLIALSREPLLKLRKIDIEEAIDCCTNFTANVEKLIAGSGKAEFAEQTNMVLQELFRQDNFEMNRAKLLQKHWGDFSAAELDRIIDTLTQAKVVSISNTGSGPVYRLEEQVILYMRSLEK